MKRKFEWFKTVKHCSKSWKVLTCSKETAQFPIWHVQFIDGFLDKKVMLLNKTSILPASSNGIYWTFTNSFWHLRRRYNVWYPTKKNENFNLFALQMYFLNHLRKTWIQFCLRLLAFPSALYSTSNLQIRFQVRKEGRSDIFLPYSLARFLGQILKLNLPYNMHSTIWFLNSEIFHSPNNGQVYGWKK